MIDRSVVMVGALVALLAGCTVTDRANDGAAPDSNGHRAATREASVGGHQAALTSTSAPRVGNEFDLDDPVIGPAADSYLSAADIATMGSTYFMTWFGTVADHSGLFLSRISAEGTVLDPLGVPLHPYPSEQRGGGIACNPSVCLVCFGEGSDIYVRRFDSSASPIDPQPVHVSSGNYSAVVFNGSDFLVGYMKAAGTHLNLYARRISATTGALLGSEIPVSTASQYKREFSVAWSGSQYLFAWETFTAPDAEGTWTPLGLMGARVDPAGTLLDPDGFALSAGKSAMYPDVTSDGQDFALVWENGSGYGLNAARVQADASIAPFVLTSSTPSQGSLSITWDGQDYVAAWSEVRSNVTSTRAARITSQGTVLDPGGIQIGDIYQSYTELSSNGEALLAIFGAMDGFQAKRFAADLNAIDSQPFVVAESANAERDVAVCKTAQGHLLVWEDSRDGGALRGSQLDAAANLLDPKGFLIAEKPEQDTHPTMASDGTNCLLVWGNLVAGAGTTQLLAARVQTDGTLLDATPRVLDASVNAQSIRSVAWNGSHYLVVYTIDRNVVAVRLDQAANVVDATPIAVGMLSENLMDLDVASDGQNFLVTWVEGNSFVSARLVSNNGTAIGNPFELDSLNYGADNLAVAWNGTDYLVVAGSNEVKALRVSATGTIGAPTAGILISTSGVDYGGGLDVISAGQNSLVAWASQTTDTTQLLGLRVSESGSVLDPSPFVISERALVGGADLEGPALSSATGTSVLAAFDVFDAESRAYRARARFLDTVNVLGATCNDGAQCASSFCVDGICCNEACGNGTTTDCQACNVAAGASQDGSCAPVTASSLTVCRAAASECDSVEVCDGVSTVCPDDLAQTEGAACGTFPTDPCDAQDTCSGTTGASAVCVPNSQPQGTTCREASGPCDLAETCDGTSPVCPADGKEPQGTDCSDGNMCTAGDQCDAEGACVSSPVTCDDGEECTADSCAAAAGCTFAPVSDSSSCALGAGRCRAGHCELTVPDPSVDAAVPLVDAGVPSMPPPTSGEPEAGTREDSGTEPGSEPETGLTRDAASTASSDEGTMAGATPRSGGCSTSPVIPAGHAWLWPLFMAAARLSRASPRPKRRQRGASPLA